MQPSFIICNQHLPSFHLFPSKQTFLRQQNLRRPSQRAKSSQLILAQPVRRRERSKNRKRSARCTLRHRNSSATYSTARDGGVGDISHHIDEAYVKRCIRRQLDEESIRVIGESEQRAGERWGLEVGFRSRRFEREFREDRKRKLLGARDDEHLREVIRKDGAKSRIERIRERGSADASAEVSVMASFDGEDRGGCDFQCRVIGEELCAAEEGADADGGDHVGEVDEGGGGVVGEVVGACGDGSVAGFLEDGGDGGGVGCFVLS